jgi:hypothetical protein
MGLLSSSAILLDKKTADRPLMPRITHLFWGALLASPFFAVGLLFMTPHVQNFLFFGLAPHISDHVALLVTVLVGGSAVWVLADAALTRLNRDAAFGDKTRVVRYGGLKWMVVLPRSGSEFFPRRSNGARRAEVLKILCPECEFEMFLDHHCSHREWVLRCGNLGCGCLQTIGSEHSEVSSLLSRAREHFDSLEAN